MSHCDDVQLGAPTDGWHGIPELEQSAPLRAALLLLAKGGTR